MSTNPINGAQRSGGVATQTAPTPPQKTTSTQNGNQTHPAATTRRADVAQYGAHKRTEIEKRLDQTANGVGNTAKGIEADRVVPQRYRLEPQRGDTVTGVRDTKAGKVRGNPPKPVGEWLIRLDRADPPKTPYPHINRNPKLTGVADPHTRISPNTLSRAGKAARGLEAAGRVARPVAVITDTIRLGNAVRADGGQVGQNTKVTAGSVAGGWAGAAGGAWLGAKTGALLGSAIGSVIPGAGTAVGAGVGGLLGGIGGGIGGAFGGSWLGEHAAKNLVR